MARQGRARSGRSNMYSESKYTNWTPYDPQQSEINKLRVSKPAANFVLDNGENVKLYKMDLHDSFVRPFDERDVIWMLNKLPVDMLHGLERIVLFGGTTRQAKSAWHADWSYGCYGYASIYLFAFPVRRMKWPSKKLHRPSELLAYERAGVKIIHESKQWVYYFDENSLRRFYLWDVLVHEVGHHVDRHHPDRSRKRSERFAEFFARTYGFEK